MIVQYKPNAKDTTIIGDITQKVRRSLGEWYGAGSRLHSENPEIRSNRNSFMLRYPITNAGGQEKTVLVKIRRNPKMESLSQAVEADIHQNIPTEWQSLEFVYTHLAGMEENFSAIRPLVYFDKYFAIIMEEVPSRTLRQLLTLQRSAKTDGALNELRDAARKTGRWLHYFHHHMHVPTERKFSTDDILLEVLAYADRIQSRSHGRVQAQPIMEAFSRKLENIPVDRVIFSQSHADMTCDNVLYSEDQRVCIIDIKTRPAPVYADLGLILIHPETSKPQIFSRGAHFPESLLRIYRAEIVAGYFEEEPGANVLARVYSAVMVLDKWLMYEDLMSRYKGVKHYLARPAGPFVSSYFQKLLKKHLNLIEDPEPGQALKLANTVDRAA